MRKRMKLGGGAKHDAPTLSREAQSLRKMRDKLKNFKEVQAQRKVFVKLSQTQLVLQEGVVEFYRNLGFEPDPEGIKGMFCFGLGEVSSSTKDRMSRRSFSKKWKIPISAKVYTMGELQSATNGLSEENFHGEGSLGSVYKADLLNVQASEMAISNTGYVAREHIQNGFDSVKGDISAFGVLLLELLTGKRPFNGYDAFFLDQGKEQSLVNESWKIWWIQTSTNYSPPGLSRFPDIVSLCVQPEKEFRPPIAEIEESLSFIMHEVGTGETSATDNNESDPFNGSFRFTHTCFIHQSWVGIKHEEGICVRVCLRFTQEEIIVVVVMLGLDAAGKQQSCTNCALEKFYRLFLQLVCHQSKKSIAVVVFFELLYRLWCSIY
ncbi:hypothetical protein RHGRI_020708 [Rhododendron griersonianum]|uniref:Protein kinase domain-containing protein n=1 Tax=Rhododendron griersonianum TaxID=479676 RepID=A0AAV6JIM8_9ERIC|nr:hypothetical protein RHGRI_020708 [Rhododendron griersonianum]